MGDKLKSLGGFTLIEMLVIVALFGIFASASIPVLASSMSKVETVADKISDRKAMEAAAVQGSVPTLVPGSTEIPNVTGVVDPESVGNSGQVYTGVTDSGLNVVVTFSGADGIVAETDMKNIIRILKANGIKLTNATENAGSVQ